MDIMFSVSYIFVLNITCFKDVQIFLIKKTDLQKILSFFQYVPAEPQQVKIITPSLRSSCK